MVFRRDAARSGTGASCVSSRDAFVLCDRACSLARTLGAGSCLIIDRGFASGIRAFDPVVTGSGLLVGVVTEVGSSSSRVSLLSNKDTRIGARVMGDAQTSGIIEGGQGPVLVLRYVSKEASMTVNTLYCDIRYRSSNSARSCDWYGERRGG